MLSLKQINDVCLVRSSVRRCRYLDQDDTNSSKWYCLKQSSKKDEIDEEIVDYLDDLSKRGIDPSSKDIPLGDNCKGYPIFKNKLQGYDIV